MRVRSNSSKRINLLLAEVLLWRVCMCVYISVGFSQGVRRSIGGLATILGPLWAGGLTGNLHVMLGMMLFLLTLIMVSVSAVIYCIGF